jgi:hypothetical protein
MLKKLCFVAALAVGTLAISSTANARHPRCGGYYPVPVPIYPVQPAYRYSVARPYYGGYGVVPYRPAPSISVRIGTGYGGFGYGGFGYGTGITIGRGFRYPGW